MKSRKSKIIVAAISVLGSLIFACGVFFLGYFTRTWTLSESTPTYDWAVSLIDEYYAGDFREEGTVSLPISGYTAQQLALKSLTAKLDDYSAYYTAEEYKAVKEDNAGSKTGIGFSYRAGNDDGILVSRVVGNSPAYFSGMKDGDILISGTADGKTVEFVNSETQTASQILSAFIADRADGEEFSLNTAGKSFTVSKQNYVASYASLHTNSTAWGFKTAANGKGLAAVENMGDAIDYLPENTAYLKLSQFYGTAAGEVGFLLSKFNALKCTSLIIDLRGNGGGFVSVMCDIAGYLVPSDGNSNVAMVAKYKSGYNEFAYCYNHAALTENLLPAGTNVYVLANSETASASEALIGVLVSYGVTDYKNIFVSDYSDEYSSAYGMTKTARSYGKGIMQTTFERYQTGEALKLTTAKIYWPNGVCIHGTGLSAENGCTVVNNVGAINARNDNELKQVLQVISSR